MHRILAYKADEFLWWIQIVFMARHKATKLTSWDRVHWMEHFVKTLNDVLLQLKENHLIIANRIWKRRWYKKRVNWKSHKVSLVVPVRKTESVSSLPMVSDSKKNEDKSSLINKMEKCNFYRSARHIRGNVSVILIMMWATIC